ncbi:MAG TPA: hypothetical protein VIX19_11565 [Terriglobales bacterium]
MPYNLTPAEVAPGAVLPQSLCTSFVETNVYPLLTVTYNDGSYEASVIQDGVNPPRSLRTWVLAKRITTAQLTTLANFWNTQGGGLNPFYFYDPFGVAPGEQIGSNYDPTGSNQQGRATCFFRGNWGQQTNLGRHVVGNLTLVEVA